ncbi:chitooligosaccharidolytic beta-N-acetylglucosaminidase [Neodiprion pinetum]|uniref:chitooligosaccharidolytic beta-N-acetylglucosaminidase n=1 Tax=Neodiprion pinetum TaxID=441929 RepID=UPI001EE09057|nr:chitooligosaccharidolytic beta-N-acetylglucosaminidase [Neodiprion pinetum]
MGTGSVGMITVLAISIFLLYNCANAAVEDDLSSPWSYECKAGNCQKIKTTPKITTPLSLGVCQLFCGEAGALWPRPTGHLSLGNFVLQLNPNEIHLHDSSSARTESSSLIAKNIEILKNDLRTMGGDRLKSGGRGLIVHLGPRISSENVKLTLETDESYILQISELGDGRLNASIDAKTYFGARHGLETLSQLIVYDDLYNKIQIVRDAYIVDGPVYPYRGVLLDTSRNFVDKPTILRTIRAMGMNKMNTFHWHITDSHSFPYESSTYPEFSNYGAYTPQNVYSNDDIKEILEYALLQGVRVMPEFDAPAHVGEGWQWVGDNTTVCFKKEPWLKYCVEPPCGQLNPASDRVYEILGGIYKDMITDFQPDIFHMGGDEVNINCWNTSDNLKEWMTSKGWGHKENDFYKVWDHFQSRALEKYVEANAGKQVPIIMWTSGLTNEENIKILNPSKYIIQIWTTGEDETIARLIRNNFKVIFSNYDAWYLDCGFGAWVGEGNNWCSPYKGWQKVYDNSPLAILTSQGFSPDKKNQILGGEATLWSEQTDSTTIDSRLWPRTAAVAERLWSEPKSSWIHAEHRMLMQRERMVAKGINADSLQPQWCAQNQGHCYL